MVGGRLILLVVSSGSPSELRSFLLRIQSNHFKLANQMWHENNSSISKLGLVKKMTRVRKMLPQIRKSSPVAVNRITWNECGRRLCSPQCYCWSWLQPYDTQVWHIVDNIYFFNK
jgi:hypothetical protein